MARNILAAVSLVLFLSNSLGQDSINERPPFMLLDFRNVALVELALTDTPSIAIVTSQIDHSQSRPVPVTKTRTETRTRIAVVNGKQVEQSYVVAVPYVEMVEQQVTKVNEPTVIPIAKIKAWDVNGKKIEAADLVRRVSKPVAAFLLPHPWGKGVSIEPSHHAALRKDVVFLHTSSIPAR